MRKLVLASAFIVAGILSATHAAAQATKPTRTVGKFTVTETKLGDLGTGKDIKAMRVSPDQQHVAWLMVDETGKKQCVALDGKPGDEFPWIIPGSLRFTADSQHLTYIVQDNDKVYVVTGGKKGKAYYEILNGEVYCPTADYVAYFAKATKESNRVLVINGKEGKEFDKIWALSFSPDGQHIAYAAEALKKQFFMIDGQPSTEYEQVAGQAFIWSADNKRVAYVAVRGTGKDKKAIVVVDGKEQVTAEDASRVFFSPDSKHVAYMVTNGGKNTFYYDGKPVKEFDRAMGDSIRFSPDSSRLSFVASRPDKKQVKDEKGNAQQVPVDRLFFVLFDGTKTENLRDTYDGLVMDSFLFSRDSKRTAYAAVKDRKFVVVIDGLQGSEYDRVNLLQFSPDSKKVAYLGSREGRAYCVIDNGEGLGYLVVANLVFSKEGGRLAYAAARDKSNFVVVDGVEGKNYTGVAAETLQFSTNGKHFAYLAQDGTKPFFVIDNNEKDTIGDFTNVIPGSFPIFDSPNTLRALILRDKVIYKLQVTAAD